MTAASDYAGDGEGGKSNEGGFFHSASASGLALAGSNLSG